MNILQTMPCRIKTYESTLQGFKITDTYLIALNDTCNGGHNMLIPAGYTDYTGSFLYIPFFSNFLNISSEKMTILFFLFYGIFCISLSLIGLNIFFKSKTAKIHGTLSILILGILCISVSDTYSFYGLTSLALIPWWSKLYLFNFNHHKKYFFLIILTGAIIGFSNSVRGHSGNDVLFGIIALVFFTTFKHKNIKKLSILCLLILPIFLINFQIEQLQKKARNYLINNAETHTLIDSKQLAGFDLNFVRAIWHNAYYNLGYLSKNNQKNASDKNFILNENEPIIHSDVYSVKKAQSIVPNIIPYSAKYEMLLKNEYFKFIKKEPFLYLKIITKKATVIFAYILIFFNIGFYYIYKKKFRIETIIFFSVGIMLNTLFGLIAEPDYPYLLGLFAYLGLFTTSLIEDSYLQNSSI